jgi:hypothetical protein
MKSFWLGLMGLLAIGLLGGCGTVRSPSHDVEFVSPNPGSQYDQASQPAVQPQNNNPNVLAGKMISY